MKKIFTSILGLATMFAYAQTTQTFNYTGSLQTFVVPSCVNSITISAKAGQGGYTDFSGGKTGGLGAHITGTFTVAPGQVIKVLVGGMGEKLTPGSGGNYLSAGGGGGTFVWDSINNTNPLIVAGGGGGANSCSYTNGDPGLATLGGTGLGGATLCGTGCDNGNGVGGGGAGWNGNGASCGGCAVAQSPLNGAAGGVPCMPLGNPYLGGVGGYGGGGQGDGNCGGGGGGGGYTGGSGGANTIICANDPSRGGSSYNAGTAQTNLGGINAGNGVVTITYTSSVVAGTATVLNDTLCYGDSTSVNLTGENGTIQWQISTDGGNTWNPIPNATSNSHATSALTTNTCYRADVTCGNAVFSNVVCIVVNPLPTVTFSMQDTVCLNNGTVTLTSGTPNGGTYSGNGVTGNVFNPQTAGLGTHAITYSYTDVNGCSNQAIFNVVVDLCAGINEMNPLRNISIYPNPTRGNVVVNLPNGIDKLKAEVLDMQGKVMFVNENIQVTSGQGELNIQHLSNGLYHINFTSAAYKHAVKIALQK
jgi:hypothetical protein